MRIIRETKRINVCVHEVCGMWYEREIIWLKGKERKNERERLNEVKGESCKGIRKKMERYEE